MVYEPVGNLEIRLSSARRAVALDKMRVGDSVKICINHECFWVSLTEITDSMFSGTVANVLNSIDHLRYGDLIQFPHEDVVETMTSSERDKWYFDENGVPQREEGP